MWVMRGSVQSSYKMADAQNEVQKGLPIQFEHYTQHVQLHTTRTTHCPSFIHGRIQENDRVLHLTLFL